MSFELNLEYNPTLDGPADDVDQIEESHISAPDSSAVSETQDDGMSYASLSSVNIADSAEFMPKEVLNQLKSHTRVPQLENYDYSFSDAESTPNTDDHASNSVIDGTFGSEITRKVREEGHIREKSRMLIQREIQYNRMQRDEKVKKYGRSRAGNYHDPVHSEEVYLNPAASMVTPEFHVNTEAMGKRGGEEAITSRTRTNMEKIKLIREWNTWKKNSKEYEFYRKYIVNN